MSFLDRFKPQPKWKNADPAIRLAAIPEIPDDDEHREVLVALAREDADPRVRRAALGRVSRVDDLVALARAETDDEMRKAVAAALVQVATSDAPHDGDAALALEGISEEKHFATVAKESPHDTVRTAALARVHETRLLGSIARNAADGQLALAAVARLADVGELIGVASRTEHRDAGMLALERSREAGVDREVLEEISERARHKAVGKRARQIVQEIDDAEAVRRAALERRQQQLAAVVARLEAIVAAPDVAEGRTAIDTAEADWRELGSDPAFAIDDDTVARYGALRQQALDAVDAHERRVAAEHERAERLQAMRRVRLDLCELVETARADDALEVANKARAEWEGLPAAEEMEAEHADLARRFEEACRRAGERHANRQEIRRMQERLEALSYEAERLASQDELPEDAWRAAATEWHSLRPSVDELDEAVSSRFAAAEGRVGEREDERRAAEERALRQQVQRVEQLIDRVHKRAGAEDLTLREAEKAARDLKNATDTPPTLPPADRQALLERLKAAHALLSPRLHELREMDEWKRFANAAIQEELIGRTEALRTRYGFDRAEGPTGEELEKAARELHEIQERWKQAAEAPRAQAQALWHRYRQAADPIQARLREFYSQRAGERQENLARKLAIIERAEALADSTDWIRTADELKKLQAEWQQIGPVPRSETRVTWKRFREACDRFFTRRNADLAERKEVWSTNLARKEVLIARAEELAGSTEWDKAAAEIRRLQAEWKTIGPVRRNKSESVWQRFRTACDAFFDRYKRRDEIELETKQADREALVVELEGLAPADGQPAGIPEGLLAAVRDLRSRWNRTTPAVRQGADPLSARFSAALERLIAVHPEAFRGTELDIDANRQKMEKLCARVEGLASDISSAPAPASSSQALADMLREALAANTIGGRGGDDAKWKAMADDVRQAQASWNRLGPVPGDTGRELSERFHKACNRFFEHYRRRASHQQAKGSKPVGAR